MNYNKKGFIIYKRKVAGGYAMELKQFSYPSNFLKKEEFEEKVKDESTDYMHRNYVAVDYANNNNYKNDSNNPLSVNFLYTSKNDSFEYEVKDCNYVVVEFEHVSITLIYRDYFKLMDVIVSYDVNSELNSIVNVQIDSKDDELYEYPKDTNKVNASDSTIISKHVISNVSRKSKVTVFLNKV